MSGPDPDEDGGYTGQLDREAARWCARMHGDDAERLRPEFEQWLRLGALHRQTYNKVKEIYLLGARASWPEPTVLSVPAPLLPRALPRWLLAGVAATLFATVALRPILDQTSPVAGSGRGPIEISASSSPQRIVLLDGSRVDLDPASLIRVAFSGQVRQLTLIRGAALFAVAHEVRPFVVEAAGLNVTARGTRFMVDLTAVRSVEVHVLQGMVDVQSRTALAETRSGPRRLRAGEEASFAAAPRSGERGANLIGLGNETPQPHSVGELVAAANARPGNRVRLLVDDPALLLVQLGGSFDKHDPEAVAARLAAILDLTIDRSHPGSLVLRRSDAAK